MEENIVKTEIPQVEFSTFWSAIRTLSIDEIIISTTVRLNTNVASAKRARFPRLLASLKDSDSDRICAFDDRYDSK